MFSWARSALALATIVFVCTPASAQYWVLTDLGDISNCSGHLRPMGLSPDGVVVGTAIGSEAEGQQGFIWQPLYPNATTGQSAVVPTPVAGASVVVCEAVNSQGQVAGWLVPGDDLPSVAFRWDRQTGQATLLGGPGSRVLDLNEAGVCAGYSGTDAWLWGPDAESSLADSGPFAAISASGINNNGATAGCLAVPGAPGACRVGLWTTGGAFDLGVPPGSISAQGRAINDAGQIAGECLDPGQPVIYPRMFLWNAIEPGSSIGFYSDLGMVGSHELGMVNDINNNGAVVGTELQNGDTKAFMWKPDAPNSTTGSRVLLSTLILPGSGWMSLDEANAINDFGQIVGVGRRSGGVKRGYLLTPLPNPLPRIMSLVPASVRVGAGAVTITISGSGFTPSSRVRVGAEQRPTTFVSTTRLEAAIGSNDTVSPCSLAVNVCNPEPGGGTSNTAVLEVGSNPQPTITSVSPNPLFAGGTGVEIDVAGSGYVPASVVVCGGQALETQYLSPQEVKAFVPGSLTTAAGLLAVSISTPAPGGGTSTPFVITVAANPAPMLTCVSPDVVMTGSSGLYLYAYGGGFTPNCQLRYGTTMLATTASNESELVAYVPETLLENPGTLLLDVVSPSPGGGVSVKKPLVVTSSPAPIARDDSAETGIDAGVAVNVALNDADPDFSEFHLAQISATSAGGSVVDDGGGVCYYQPKAGFVGADSFSYRLIDGDNNYSNWARVTVQVGTVPIFSLAYMSPATAEPGELVTAVVDVVDSNGYVASVKAGNKSLTSTDGKHWTGLIPAPNQPGHQVVQIEAVDNSGNKRYTSARYVVAPVVFTRIRDLGWPVSYAMAWTNTYKVAGRVNSVQPLSFQLGETAADPGLLVDCAGHGARVGDFVVVRGELQKRNGKPALAVSSPSKVQLVTGSP